MQVLIEISKEAYEKIQTKSMLISASAIDEVVDAVKHGKVCKGWIPVSERLPNSSGVYIITRKFNDGFECKDLTEACYFDSSTWYGDNRINHKREYIERKIIAWMPLPEPFKSESEDKE